jgi:hypothetical protein
VASRKKGIRSDKESGPIRISDHIYEWFIRGEQLLTPSEVDFIERYEKVIYAHDTSVYKNKDGEEYPEIWNGIRAMIGYKFESNARRQEIQQGQRQSFDLG